MTPMLRRLALLPVAAALIWLGGFIWFVNVAHRPAVPPPPSDGIVVLTGGADRVAVGLHLLAEGRAGLLLISGVGGAADFRSLARRAEIDLALEPKVTIGHAADSTHGNALETAAWARAHGIRTLIVVTAGYHMPRALAELRASLPEVTLHPASVHPERADTHPQIEASFWGSLRTLAGEFSKYIAVELGIADIAARVIQQVT